MTDVFTKTYLNEIDYRTGLSLTSCRGDAPFCRDLLRFDATSTWITWNHMSDEDKEDWVDTVMFPAPLTMDGSYDSQP